LGFLTLPCRVVRELERWLAPTRADSVGAIQGIDIKANCGNIELGIIFKLERGSMRIVSVMGGGLHFAFLGIAAILLLASSNVSAGTYSSERTALISLSRAQALVSGASHGRARAISVFPGPDGLEGIVVTLATKDSARSIIWATPNAKAVLIGNLVDAQGQNLNELAEVARGLRMNPLMALHAATQPASMSVLTPGSGPILTFFIDPNCIFCNRLYRAIEPDVSAGKLRIRFVLVGIVKKDSPERAMSILSSADPLKAIGQDETHFDAAIEEGGYPIMTNPTPATAAVLKANDQLMSRMGAVGTPTLLYCSKAADGHVEMMKGVPADIPSFVSDLATGPAPECRA
jgi:thiol:disulfide interchange protein DsbG